MPRSRIKGEFQLMPVIVAFGDSNTWGYDPATGGRFPRAQRWPSILQRELGPDFEVIAEDLNGHTTVHDDPIRGRTIVIVL